jgi:hypothetical protein
MQASSFEEAFLFEPHRHIDAHSYGFLWFNVGSGTLFTASSLVASFRSTKWDFYIVRLGSVLVFCHYFVSLMNGKGG